VFFDTGAATKTIHRSRHRQFLSRLVGGEAAGLQAFTVQPKRFRKAGGPTYLGQTNALVPKIFERNVWNFGLVLILCGFLLLDYSVGGYITKLNGKVPGVPVQPAGSDL